MNEITTTDFSRFGYREREMAEELLRASRENGFPEDFEQDGLQIMMNFNSGNVFFTNSEYQVAMMNGEDLESFYSSPYEGKEGFFSELLGEYKEMHPEDQEWFRQIAENLSKEDELPEIE